MLLKMQRERRVAFSGVFVCEKAFWPLKYNVR